MADPSIAPKNQAGPLIAKCQMGETNPPDFESYSLTGRSLEPAWILAFVLAQRAHNACLAPFLAKKCTHFYCSVYSFSISAIKLQAAELAAHRAAEAALVQGPYLALGAALLMLGVLFALARLARISHGDKAPAQGGLKADSVLKQPHLLLGAIGIFLYVGGEVSIGSFLINFLAEKSVASMAPAQAAHYVSFYWGGVARWLDVLSALPSCATPRKPGQGVDLQFGLRGHAAGGRHAR